jgi:hypothetical protein
LDYLDANVFALPEPSRAIAERQLWAQLANDADGVFADKYAYRETWGFRICVKAEATPSPDRQVIRYRTIEGGIRRKPGRQTLLDLAVSNLFADAATSGPEPLRVVNDPKYAVWARQVGQISLVDHIRLVQQFVADLMDAGWQLGKAALTPFKINSPKVRNGQGARSLPTDKFSQLARDPARSMDADRALAVVWPDASQANWAAGKLADALTALLRSGSGESQVRVLREVSPSAVNLVLLDDREDLTDLTALREELRTSEATGIRYKLAKLGSMSKPYPAQNIAFDMFQLAGGRFWVPDEAQPEFCCMDAGHDMAGNRTRWVKVEAGSDQTITSVRVFDTRLAEHVPADLVDDMWPSVPTAIACRDGRLSQERATMEARAKKEGRPLIECKKSPKAVLWRTSGSGEIPADFGDAVIDEHDEILLQTMHQNPRDYVHPVRLALHGGDAIDLSTAFLHQHAMPSLSLFRMSRLPGALYFADLVSKLTSDGWPKVVGRGFGIPSVIP